MATTKNQDPTKGDEFEKEATGFPAYWNPEPGKSFVARVITVDDSDPAFIRYVLQSEQDEAIPCQRGPSDDAEDVSIAKGEFFTVSKYVSLPLENYIDCKVKVAVKDKRHLKKSNRDMWEFDLFASKEDKAKLIERREAKAAQLPAGMR